MKKTSFFLILSAILILFATSSWASNPFVSPGGSGGGGGGSGDITSVFGDLTGAVNELFQTAAAISDGDTTPDVSGGIAFKTANTGSTIITDFDAGGGSLQDHKFIWVFVKDGNTTFVHGSGLVINGGANFTAADGDWVQCIHDDDGDWLCHVVDISGRNATDYFSSGTIAATRLPDAGADGSTQGVASFAPNDFEALGGNISIDKANHVPWVDQEVTTDADPYTLTPSAGGFVRIRLTPHAANVDITLAETNAVDMQMVAIINEGPHTVYFADSSGVLELPTPVSLATHEGLVAQYWEDRYLRLNDTNAMSTSSITLGEIKFDSSLSSDDTYSGESITGKNAGESISQWDAVYLNSTDNEFHQADANASGEWPAWGIAVACDSAGGDEWPCLDGEGLTVLVKGTIRNDGWSWSDDNVKLYLGETAGGLTETAPSDNTDCVQPMGRVMTITNDVVYFNIDPINGYGEV